MKTNALLFLATVLWGIWGIADKYALSRAHPFTVQWMYSIPYILFLPFWYFLSKKAAAGPTFDLQALGWSVLACICSVTAMALMFFAMRSQSASTAVALTSAYPLVTLLLAVVVRTEQLTVPKITGMLLIVAGVIVLQFNN